jgi:hypothetical protein
MARLFIRYIGLLSQLSILLSLIESVFQPIILQNGLLHY